MTELTTIVRKNDAAIDELEVKIVENGVIDFPLKHEFTKGMYIRTIFMPAFSELTSKIHRTCHPFEVLKGAVLVSIDGSEWELITAPYRGVTYPGTRRVLFNLADTYWSTFHAIPWITGEENNLCEEDKKKVVERIEDEILEPYINKLLLGMPDSSKIKYTKKEAQCLTFWQGQR